MALDLATAQTHLDEWLAADSAVSAGRSYTIGSGESTRILTLEDSIKISEKIDYLQTEVAQLKASDSAGADDYARHSPGVRVARWTR